MTVEDATTTGTSTETHGVILSDAAAAKAKAKTAERLGPVGQGLAMEARAVVLLHRH